MPFRTGIASAVCIAAMSSLVPGCQRKAPGPDECRVFAHRVVGVRDERQLRFPGVRVRVDELTRSCLVTPYDRELMRCVELGAPPLACMRDFTARAALRARS